MGMNEAEARAIFLLAGIEVESVYELPNGYWPDAYTEERRRSPWWLLKTPFGLIRMGWRKRVISIDWSDTSIRGVVTEHDVTKDEHMVHAWTYHNAVEYMTAWAALARRAEREAVESRED